MTRKRKFIQYLRLRYQNYNIRLQQCLLIEVWTTQRLVFEDRNLLQLFRLFHRLGSKSSEIQHVKLLWSGQREFWIVQTWILTFFCLSILLSQSCTNSKYLKCSSMSRSTWRKRGKKDRINFIYIKILLSNFKFTSEKIFNPFNVILTLMWSSSTNFWTNLDRWLPLRFRKRDANMDMTCSKKKCKVQRWFYVLLYR